MNGAWRGRLNVSCCGYPDDDLEIQFQHRPSTPTEPTLVYLLRGATLARVDVNGPHKGRRFTHLQWYQAAGEKVRTEDVPEWFRTVPLGPMIEEDVLEAAFRDAARTLHVNVAGATWLAPPEGSAR